MKKLKKDDKVIYRLTAWGQPYLGTVVERVENGYHVCKHEDGRRYSVLDSTGKIRKADEKDVKHYTGDARKKSRPLTYVPPAVSVTEGHEGHEVHREIEERTTKKNETLGEAIAATLKKRIEKERKGDDNEN